MPLWAGGAGTPSSTSEARSGRAGEHRAVVRCVPDEESSVQANVAELGQHPPRSGGVNNHRGVAERWTLTGNAEQSSVEVVC